MGEFTTFHYSCIEPKGVQMLSVGSGGISIQRVTGGSISLHLVTLTMESDLYSLKQQRPRRVPGAKEQRQTLAWEFLMVRKTGVG